MVSLLKYLFLKDFLNLFSERGEGKEKGGERNIDVWEKHCWVASRTPPTRNLAQTQASALTGIEPETLRFVGQCPTDWAMLVRALRISYCSVLYSSFCWWWSVDCRQLKSQIKWGLLRLLYYILFIHSSVDRHGATSTSWLLRTMLPWTIHCMFSLTHTHTHTHTRRKQGRSSKTEF